MSLQKRKEEKAASEVPIDKGIIIDTLSSRIAKDVSDALKHVDPHEVIGILEIIKMHIGLQVFNAIAEEVTQ